MTSNSSDPSAGRYSQRYECTTTGCNFDQLLPHHPEWGPVYVRAGCEWCDTRTRQKAVGRDPRFEKVVEEIHANHIEQTDNHDQQLNTATMIDLTNDPDASPARVLGHLRRNGQIKTPVDARPDGTAAGTIILAGGDDSCEFCEAPIAPDSFGDGAPVALILAKQKRKRGFTFCDDCYDKAQEKDQDRTREVSA